ncbi:MAG: glycogen phosphorylase, partial [Clostridia bacterium]|nr:glycogen phosphorylase [Clostridia bacterium]
MPLAHLFDVQLRLPEKLQPLAELACNLYWPRYREAADLFRRLDPGLWEAVVGNPILFLRLLRAERLQARAGDPAFTGEVDRIGQDYRAYLEGPLAGGQEQGLTDRPLIAYFSAEFGLSPALPIYAGGLGILAGDHLKSASDLGLPLVGVGLLYREGYFRQRLDYQGWQQEIYPASNFFDLPLELERQADGSPRTVQIAFPDREVWVQVWRARVGRLNLYLLDADCPDNREDDRRISDRLYGGDLEKRIQQEILLGIGGVRALVALGLEPTICHLNEGHSAFLALERVRYLKEKYNLDFAAAAELAASGHIFTTHTPVAAGIDLFPPYLMDKYFTEYYQSLGLSRQKFLGLGRKDPYNQQEPFNMAVLALHLSSWANGVSNLHGRTARRMWQSLWSEVPEEELPIRAITNGVHTLTWVGDRLSTLYDRYMGPAWRDDPAGEASWAGIASIPARELWQAHEEQRAELVGYARRKLAGQLAARGAGRQEIAAASEVLHPDALTIGFARRFAAYKRPTLLFSQPERLARLLNDPRRPVQIIYAGKAHPGDAEGKKLIQALLVFAHQAGFRSHLVFLEDYDLEMARYLVQGVDVWLGNPRRPLEASSTSGMKAVLNGALHVSTLDGWWDEAWTPAIGWAIGCGEDYTDDADQDARETELLYQILEKEVIPLFYDRDTGGLPSGWVAMMKDSIQTLAPVFNTHRMVQEYNRQFYLPGASLYQRLAAGGQAGAREMAAWRARVRDGWSQVKVEKVEDDRERGLAVGDNLAVRAVVSPGPLQPEDIRVEIYFGPVDAGGTITQGETEVMQLEQA